jgi:HD superfamily phosphohydrolase
MFAPSSLIARTADTGAALDTRPVRSLKMRTSALTDARGRGEESMAAKVLHEIRDPIHVFVRLDSVERALLNSPPFQRLRHIHQLALSYLVYPGATHKRFEHSLGVMELATRIFDVVTHRDSLTEDVRRVLPEVTQEDAVRYWRRVLRIAALCHDIGHLPFSHAAEAELLPAGIRHEDITRELILSDHIAQLCQEMTPPLRPEDVAKIAVGTDKAGEGVTFSTWEAILAEIIVGDVFGADRMDYLLRDSHHAGVMYGRFDHYRLIDTLRILPSVEEEGAEPTLGVEEGGRESAEAHLLARYFMYSQVYLHPIRRIYDIHLKDFLKEWLPNGVFDPAPDEHLKLTDNEVIVALREAAADAARPGHDPACRILEREHFKILYKRAPSDLDLNPEPGRAVFEAAGERYTPDDVRHDRYRPRSSSYNFPVLMNDDRLEAAAGLSEVLVKLPALATDSVFIRPELEAEAESWRKANLEKILEERRESES